MLAAKGYPTSPEKGAVITLPENTADSRIFHAGTKTDEQGRCGRIGRPRALCRGTGLTFGAGAMMAYKLCRTVLS